MAWAEKTSILVGNDNHGELLESFGAILRDIFSSQDEIDETGLEAGDPVLVGNVIPELRFGPGGGGGPPGGGMPFGGGH